MSGKPRTRDTRVKASRAGEGLSRLVGDIMTGQPVGRPGAESCGARALCGIVQLYLCGEGPLPDALRGFVAGLLQREDPLRRDIPLEVWSALWPTLNALVEGRRKYDETLAAARAAATSPSEQSSDSAGAGVLGDGA